MKLCGFEVGNDQPFFLISGTCVVESEQMSLDTAGTLKEMTAALGIPFIYKSSFDKDNRSSAGSFRGPGLEEGLRFFPQDLAGHDQAGDDADVHGCFIAEQRANLFHPAAKEGDGVKGKSQDAVSQGGETRAAGDGDGEDDQRL